MVEERKNGNGTLRRILENIIPALIVGAMAVFGTVKVMETRQEAFVATLLETRSVLKEDVKDMTEMKAWRASTDAKLEYIQRAIDRLPGMVEKFDYPGWEKRKR
jgi:hypothetical protein